jgi:ribosomal protein S18 acetylase RimI-like enzyme
MKVRLIEADYNDAAQCSDIAFLTNAYAMDEMGGAEPLPETVLNRMIEGLRDTPGAFTLLAYIEDQPVGIANCFIGFSTFEAKRLINIHDLAVIPEVRGKGIGTALLEAVQRKARTLKCCKLTLEVRDDNPAIDLYERFGFENGEPGMRFMTKEYY